MNKTIKEVVREYFPDASDNDIEFIVWERTSFPAFWKIGEDGGTPEECFRKQLQDFRDEVNMVTYYQEIGES